MENIKRNTGPTRGEPIPQKNVFAVIARSQGVCEYQYEDCEKAAVQIDHIKSRARGGSNDVWNLAHVCLSCHEEKTNNAPCSLNHNPEAWQPDGVGGDNFYVTLTNAAGKRFVP